MEQIHQEHAKVFRALCDPKRLAILELLRGGGAVCLYVDGSTGYGAVCGFLPHEDPLRIRYCGQPPGRQVDLLLAGFVRQPGCSGIVGALDYASSRGANLKSHRRMAFFREKHIKKF